MGWGWFSKTSGVDNRKRRSIEKPGADHLDTHKETAVPEPVQEFSTNSDKNDQKKIKIEKTEKATKKKKKLKNK